jgi:hypothetical protein
MPLPMSGAKKLAAAAGNENFETSENVSSKLVVDFFPFLAEFSFVKKAEKIQSRARVSCSLFTEVHD